jgi:hypothetical protein
VLSRYDRARIERLSTKIDEYRRLASAADDPIKRNRYLTLAKRAEKTRQTQRTFPLSILLWGCSGFLVIFPWALLNRSGNGIWGFIGSILMLVVLVTIKLQLRFRHR